MERRGKRNRSPDRNLDEKVLLVDKTNTNSGSADENAAIAPKAKQEKKTTKHTRRSARKSANAVVMLQATDVDSSDAADDKNDQVSSKRPEELHALVNFKKETETGIQLERCPSSSTESADEQSLIAEKLNATSSQTEEKTENPNLNSNAKKMENSEENIRKSLEELPQLTSDVIYQQCNGGEDEELAKNDLIISKTELSSYDGSVLSDELTQYSSIASSVMKIEPEEECEFQFIKIAKETNVNDNSLDRIIQELAKRSETSLPKENTKRSNIKRKKEPKFQPTSRQQIDYYLEFAKKHPEVQPGKLNANDDQLKGLWQELTDNLNALPGVRRTAEQWNISMKNCLVALSYRQSEVVTARLSAKERREKIKPLSSIEEQILKSKSLQPKYQRISQNQLDCYLKFVKKHPEIEPGKLNADEPIFKDLWKELAEKLNSLPGPTRTTQKWNLSIYNYLRQLRRRQRLRAAGHTDFSGKRIALLTPLEEHVAMISRTYIPRKSKYLQKTDKPPELTSESSPSSSNFSAPAPTPPPLTTSACSDNSGNNPIVTEVNAPPETKELDIETCLPSHLISFDDNNAVDNRKKTKPRKKKQKQRKETEPEQTPTVSLCLQNSNSNLLQNERDTDSQPNHNVPSPSSLCIPNTTNSPLQHERLTEPPHINQLCFQNANSNPLQNEQDTDSQPNHVPTPSSLCLQNTENKPLQNEWVTEPPHINQLCFQNAINNPLQNERTADSQPNHNIPFPSSLCIPNTTNSPLQNEWVTEPPHINQHCFPNAINSPLENERAADSQPNHNIPSPSYLCLPNTENKLLQNEWVTEPPDINQTIKKASLEEMFSIIQSSLQKTERFQEEMLEEQRKTNKSLQSLVETKSSVLYQLCITNKLLVDNLKLIQKDK